MSKELEVFKIIKFTIEHYCPRQTNNELALIEQALQRLEVIDNANPSEALECLENIGFAPLYEGSDSSYIRIKDEYDKDFNTIKQALIQTEKNKRFKEIVISKEVVLGMLKTCKTVEQYNAGCKLFGRNQLTYDEFNFLKEMSNNE